MQTSLDSIKKLTEIFICPLHQNALANVNKDNKCLKAQVINDNSHTELMFHETPT